MITFLKQNLPVQREALERRADDLLDYPRP